jgi:hypothetical protein
MGCKQVDMEQTERIRFVKDEHFVFVVVTIIIIDIYLCVLCVSHIFVLCKRI